MSALAGSMGELRSEAFWSEFMRRPDAQAAYEAERRLYEKKQAWLAERKAIQERGEQRRIVADALEEAPAELRKLIAPMFHIRLVEAYLWEVHQEAQRRNQENPLLGVRFVDFLQSEKHLRELRHYRTNFQEGGSERMAEMEQQNKALREALEKEQAKKQETQPQKIDMQTLKSLLEFAQECKLEGNRLYKEGLYEQALDLYSQADEAMKKWKVDKSLKNEHKWLLDSHLACLKNKSQAALSLEMFQTALDAAEDALKLDVEDHKAWFRKLQAEKGLGKFRESLESLARLEDIAQWCPDRRRILRDCEVERKKIKHAIVAHRYGTKDMLGKAFEAGVFSIDRERELEEAARQLEDREAGRDEQLRLLQQAGVPRQLGGPPPPPFATARLLPKDSAAVPRPRPPPIERKTHLTAALAGDLMDELEKAYSTKEFQERVHKCARDSGYERSVFLMRLSDAAFEVQKPVLEHWGFEGNEQGLREMTAAIRDHTGPSKEPPEWLKQKEARCLELLYGGKDSEMYKLLIGSS